MRPKSPWRYLGPETLISETKRSWAPKPAGYGLGMLFQVWKVAGLNLPGCTVLLGRPVFAVQQCQGAASTSGCLENEFIYLGL